MIVVPENLVEQITVGLQMPCLLLLSRKTFEQKSGNSCYVPKAPTGYLRIIGTGVDILGESGR